jgi:signal transduction histidine kinase
VAYEAWFSYPRGRRCIEVHYYPILRSSQVEYVVSVMRDVTERKQAEQQREEFVNLAAHEMRTPLTIFKGYLQMLTKLGAHDDREKHFFRVLEAQTSRLSRLVQTLLEASQIQKGEWPLHPTRLDLGELVREAVEAVQALQNTEQVPRQMVLTLSCEGRAAVEVDSGQIGEVLSNLLDNAVRYSPDGKPVQVTVHSMGNEAIVSVRDHGPGISQEQQARLFEAWYQAAPMVRPTTGMGLGLFISQEIVTRHGGRIWIESEVGKGSTFSFSLPLASSSSETEAIRPRSAEVPPTMGGLSGVS